MSSTAIPTYSALQTRMVDFYKDRSDLGSFAPTCIQLAHAYFNLKLRTREMETAATLSPTDNVCTLPDDYLELISVSEDTAFNQPLTQIADPGIGYYYGAGEAGLAVSFGIFGNELTLYPLSSNDVNIRYFAEIPELSDTVTSNWLLLKSPNLYLHGALAYAGELFDEPAVQQKHMVITDALIASIQELNDRAKWSTAGVQLVGQYY